MMFDLVKNISIRNNKIKMFWQMVLGLLLLVPFLYHSLVFTDIRHLSPQDMKANQGVDVILHDQIGSFWAEDYVMILGQYRDVVYHGLLCQDQDGKPYVMAISAHGDVGSAIRELPMHDVEEPSGKPLYISGGLREMGPDVQTYFDKYLDKKEWQEGEEKPYPVYYILDQYGKAPVFSWISGIIGALTLVHVIFLFAACYTGFFAKRFIQAVQMSGYREKAVEKDFMDACNAELLYDSIVTGKEFTFLRVGGMNPVILSNKKISWLYSREQNMHESGILALMMTLFYFIGFILIFFSNPFRSYYKPVDITFYAADERKYYRTSFVKTREYLGKIYDYYSRTCPWVEIGYSAAMKKTFDQRR